MKEATHNLPIEESFCNEDEFVLIPSAQFLSRCGNQRTAPFQTFHRSTEFEDDKFVKRGLIEPDWKVKLDTPLIGFEPKPA